MSDLLKHYENIIPFLALIMGNHCEVALQDLRAEKQCIVAIANGHISGREIGAPLTDLALRLVTQEIWKKEDYCVNYTGMTENGRQLRSSTYFIKDNQGTKLIGMLCINIDTSEYKNLSDRILELGQLLKAPNALVLDAENERPAHTESFYNNMDEIINSVFDELFLGTDVPPERMTQTERLSIVEKLDNRGIFLLKNSIYYVSQKLSCSEASVYRYLSKIHRDRIEMPNKMA